ncbi:hypothetical protein CspeluHIS016_0407060 [Cutaneotrichosporon spelunceum]|uniref:1-alkyl-2-acetylglycerophosphocholine esterase n=1 Tax=Cutaneotrichosporon spelunceum TaxID=1672016 RepID=A0AAD3TVW5_9TREE|nr:hypothetical protein CspeluHIS016_0407060 [Cutaneotrichosporon spelunceum]
MYIPFLASTLPESRPGLHATGYVVVRVPVPPTDQYTGTPKLQDGTPGLHLSENVLAIYYPTPNTTGHPEGVPWTPDPIAGAMTGYARFGRRNLGPWSSWLGQKILGRFRMPVHPAAPVSEGKFPLVIFSHGLVGTRNTYSQFCSSLASEGYVVVAVEHSDGSSPCVVRDGKDKVFTRLGDTDLWEDDGTDPVKAPEMMLWRAHQLDLRVREVYAAYKGFKRFLSGDAETDASATAAALQDKVDVEDLQLIGHSFGGATILRLLQTSHSSTLPVKRAVLLDPWMEPFTRALPSSPSTVAPPPTQSILSAEWVNNHFFPDLLKGARQIDASLCSIVGLSHQGFSDFGVMLPGKGHEYLQTIHTLTMARLRDQPFPFDGEPDGGEPARVDGLLAGELGKVVRHL